MNNIDLYIVKRGDTLYNIAKKHQMTWQELMKINNKNNTLLSIGEQLIVPGTAKEITYYVQKNDTLFSIANKFNIDMDYLKELNNLNTDEVILGQLITIK